MPYNQFQVGYFEFLLEHVYMLKCSKNTVLTASVLIHFCSSIGLREISNVSQAVFGIVQLKHKCYDLMHYQIIALANMH